MIDLYYLKSLSLISLTFTHGHNKRKAERQVFIRKFKDMKIGNFSGAIITILYKQIVIYQLIKKRSKIEFRLLSFSADASEILTESSKLILTIAIKKSIATLISEVLSSYFSISLLQSLYIVNNTLISRRKVYIYVSLLLIRSQICNH